VTRLVATGDDGAGATDQHSTHPIHTLQEVVMTSTQIPVHSTQALSTPQLAAATFLGSVAFNALGTFGDGTEGSEHGWGEFVIVGGFSVVAVALVFGLAVPRLRSSRKAGAVGLTLAILGLLTVPVFWAGVTPALAVGGLVLGGAARRTGRGGASGTAAVATAALALLGYVAIYVTDWMATNDILGM
jgi:hypothetical protein